MSSEILKKSININLSGTAHEIPFDCKLQTFARLQRLLSEVHTKAGVVAVVEKVQKIRWEPTVAALD